MSMLGYQSLAHTSVLSRGIRGRGSCTGLLAPDGFQGRAGGFKRRRKRGREEQEEKVRFAGSDGIWKGRKTEENMIAY